MLRRAPVPPVRVPSPDPPSASRRRAGRTRWTSPRRSGSSASSTRSTPPPGRHANGSARCTARSSASGPTGTPPRSWSTAPGSPGATTAAASAASTGGACGYATGARCAAPTRSPASASRTCARASPAGGSGRPSRCSTPAPRTARGCGSGTSNWRAMPATRSATRWWATRATWASPTWCAGSAGPATAAASTCCRWSSRRRVSRRGCTGCRPPRCRRCRSATRATRGSRNWGCAGSRCRRSPTCAWRSAASATRPPRSTAGIWAARSAPATSATPGATTSSR
jgi:hypothetical protein